MRCKGGRTSRAILCVCFTVCASLCASLCALTKVAQNKGCHCDFQGGQTCAGGRGVKYGTINSGYF